MIMLLTKYKIVVQTSWLDAVHVKEGESEILAKLVRKHMKKIIDPNVSRNEKRKMLSH